MCLSVCFITFLKTPRPCLYLSAFLPPGLYFLCATFRVNLYLNFVFSFLLYTFLTLSATLRSDCSIFFDNFSSLTHFFYYYASLLISLPCSLLSSWTLGIRSRKIALFIKINSPIANCTTSFIHPSSPPILVRLRAQQTAKQRTSSPFPGFFRTFFPNSSHTTQPTAAAAAATVTYIYIIHLFRPVRILRSIYTRLHPFHRLIQAKLQSQARESPVFSFRPTLAHTIRKSL